MDKFRPLEYKSEIDGMRAIAVMIVLLYHAAIPGFTGGFIGVDVFFVLSGFLITHQIFDEVHFKGHFSFLTFYAKRLRRLLPLIYTVIIAVLVVWGIFLTGIDEDTNKLIDSVRYSLFGLANIFLERNTGNYFDLKSDFFPLLHFWSLAVEEQFYLVWPLLLVTVSRFFGAEKIKLLLTLIIVSSFSYTMYLMSKESQGAFYWMPARAWELAAGGLIVFILPYLREIRINKIILTILSVASILVIGLCTYGFNAKTLFPGVNAIYPVLATIILILCFFKNEGEVSRILKSKPMIFTGTLSYGIYLWHWPLFSLYKNFTGTDVIPLGVSFFFITLSFILSYFSYKFIENPIRFNPILKKHQWKSVGGFLLASFMIMISSRSLRQVDVMKTADRVEFSYLKERSSLRRKCHNKIENIGTADCIIKQSSNDVKTMYVWGNSHAESFFPVVEKYAQMQGNISVSLLSASSYPAILDFEGTNHWHKARDGQAYHKKAFEFMKKSEEPFSVVYTSRWIPFFSNDEDEELIKGKITATLEQLVAIGAETIYIPLPMIEFEHYPPKCILKNKDCSVDADEFKEKRKDIVVFFQSLQTKFNNVKIIDILPLTCPGDKCSVVLDGEPVNYDSTHMSPRMGGKILKLNPNLFNI